MPKVWSVKKRSFDGWNPLRKQQQRFICLAICLTAGESGYNMFNVNALDAFVGQKVHVKSQTLLFDKPPRIRMHVNIGYYFGAVVIPYVLQEFQILTEHVINHIE